MTKQIEREEDLGSGFTYVEETGHEEHTYPARDCWLRQAGVAEPISGLNILAFRQRFGAVSVPAEGIGGVETVPAFRRQGHIRTLMTKAVEGMARRVPVAFVSDAIEGLYEKFGFVTCLVEAHLSVRVRHVERLAGSSPEGSTSHVRGLTPADLPAMVALYNQVHARRTWTHERHAAWNHLFVTETWKPGSEALIFERDRRVAGYAILRELQFGHVQSQLAVDELAANDIEAAQALLAEMAARCWSLRLSEFWVREPLDSAVGRAAQRIGCEYHQTFLATGGMMGAILDRQQLLSLLEPELRRRLPSDLQLEHTAAFDALQRGELFGDDRDMLRLLIGYWSAADARAYGIAIPVQHERIADAWFPRVGTDNLPLPYAHTLDRY